MRHRKLAYRLRRRERTLSRLVHKAVKSAAQIAWLTAGSPVRSKSCV